jgi:hypothetical protein
MGHQMVKTDNTSKQFFVKDLWPLFYGSFSFISETTAVTSKIILPKHLGQFLTLFF